MALEAFLADLSSVQRFEPLEERVLLYAARPGQDRFTDLQSYLNIELRSVFYIFFVRTRFPMLPLSAAAFTGTNRRPLLAAQLALLGKYSGGCGPSCKSDCLTMYCALRPEEPLSIHRFAVLLFLNRCYCTMNDRLTRSRNLDHALLRLRKVRAFVYSARCVITALMLFSVTVLLQWRSSSSDQICLWKSFRSQV